MIFTQYYTIPNVEIAALRPNMKAVFRAIMPFSAVSALSRIYNRLATFIPLSVKYIADKTAGANGEGGRSQTCTLKHGTYNHSTIFPRAPFYKNHDRYGTEATPKLLAIKKKSTAIEWYKSNDVTY